MSFGPDEDAFLAILGRLGKVNMPRVGKGIIDSGNIININGGGGDNS